ncbi:MAG TPA: transporter [Dyella sp.]|uniref:transporter n=1 Tax=Dyella sp. TaxID=1869338 RepID=UPI002D796007|nr:transporter [Dyella sp.]HET6552648.1 transporter [Dyella sp.]
MLTSRLLTCAGLCLLSSVAMAQQADDAADLAKKLSNPVAAMISVPLQFNYDQNIGPLDRGHRFYTNIQPVVPVPIGDDWNMISRTIVPVVDQSDIAPGSGSQFGLGDITQSLFFSPTQPTSGGVIWGVGPAFLIPTATNDLLGTRRWGLGPTAVVLKQDHGWTYGFLFNHIWSVAKVAHDREHPDVSSTFLQPFLSYTTPTAWTYTLNAESTYDWKTSQWAVPLNFTVGKLTRIGGHPVSFTGGVRYWAEHSDTGQKGWGFRFVVTFLLPQKR